jgi:hypothetical protein
MLCRAQGLLRTQPAHRLPTTGKLCSANFRRTYAAFFGDDADVKNIPSKESGDEAIHTQSNSPGDALIRHVEVLPPKGQKIFKKPRTESGDSQSASSNRKTLKNKRKTPSTGSATKQEATIPTDKVENPEQRFRHELKTLDNRVVFGTVTTSHPFATSIDELTKHIQPMSPGRVPGARESVTTLAILLTPGLARYALNDDLPKALYQRFCLRKTHKKQIHITSAVVDRLPTGPDRTEVSEGMAYVLFRDSPRTEADESTPFQESAQRPGSLTFRMPIASHGQVASVMDYELQLPLSQTVFTTGSVSTLIHRKYQLRADGSLIPVGEQKLESQTLQLPGMSRDDTWGTTDMPLVPLTPFRRIEYVMGNIIRKLSSERCFMLEKTSDGRLRVSGAERPIETGGDMPASEELERAVSRYFETLELQPETVSVWALVMPRTVNLDLPEQYHGRQQVFRPFEIQQESMVGTWKPKENRAKLMTEGLANLIRVAIPHGGRLIKVLSGGGGWGKKAGLLSLDPDVQYSTRELRQDEGWKFDFDGADGTTEAQRDQALGQIVKEGESIMFLLAPKLENMPDCPQMRVLGTPKPRRYGPKNIVGLRFGAIPSSIDTVPRQNPSDTDEAVVRYYPNYFGMLSEGGMAVTVNTAQGTTGQSKLDVPFGSFKFDYHGRYCYPELQSASQYARISQSGGADVPMGAAHETHGAEQIEQASESPHTPVEKSSEDVKLSDMFESLAQYEETDDLDTLLNGEKSGPEPTPTAQ